MHSWESIQQAIDYIEENLRKDISTEVLSEMVSLSPYYFQRLFRRLVNKPVQEYTKLRRLSKAIGKFNADEQRVLDVTLDYGVSSHANFTRALSKSMVLCRKNTKNMPNAEYSYQARNLCELCLD